MTPEKIQEVITRYRTLFDETGVGKTDFPHDELLDASHYSLRHCHRMLDKMEIFIKEGRMDKVYRWLGFIQGVLWSQRIYTLADLMDHNRKDSD